MVINCFARLFLVRNTSYTTDKQSTAQVKIYGVRLAHLDQAHDLLSQSNQVAVSRPSWIKEFY